MLQHYLSETVNVFEKQWVGEMVSASCASCWMVSGARSSTRERIVVLTVNGSLLTAVRRSAVQYTLTITLPDIIFGTRSDYFTYTAVNSHEKASGDEPG